MSRKKECIPGAEWDFDWLEDSRITPAECFACWGWEFHRELAKQAKVAARIEATRAGLLKTESGLYDLSFPLPRLWVEFSGLIFCPSWPEKPYQEATDREKEAIQHAAPENIPFQPLAFQVCVQSLQAESVRNFYGEPSGSFESAAIERKDGDGKAYSTVAAFELDWRRRDSELVDDFKRWLTAARESKIKAETMFPQKGAGAPVRQCRADLNALGAFRLRKILSWKNAVSHVSVARPGKDLYSSEAHWSEAVKRARERIEFLKELKFPKGDVRPFPKMEIPW